MFDIKSYEKADSIKEAIRLLQEDPDARLIAGGTDVLVKLHKGKGPFGRLVDIHDVEELRGVVLKENGDIVIGPGTTFTDTAGSPEVRERIPILAEAINTVGGPQIRNIATIGGNICNGVTSADSAPPLFALNATLTIQGANGARETSMEDFYLGPGRVALEHHELLTAITITRENYEGHGGHYYKYAMRNSMDIATIGCAAVVKTTGDELKDLRLAYGVAAPVPTRCKGAENLARGRRISDRLFEEIADKVIDDVNPRTSWRASKEFRLHIIKELARRVVKKAIETAGGNIH